MNGKEPRHFSKEWFWDDGLLPILKGINFLYSVFVAIVISPVKVCIWLYHHRIEVFKKGINFLLYSLFAVFVIFPIKVCVWLYHHGIEVFKLAFWFFVWFFVFIWIISKYVSISDVFIISIDGIEIYGVILLLFLYAYFKYARWEWCKYNKNRIDNEIKVVVLVASSLYEEKKYDELVEYCEEEILKHPNSLHILHCLARGKYKQGKLESSLDLFEKMEIMNPDKSYPDFSFHVEEVKQAIINRDKEIDEEKKQAIIKRDKAMVWTPPTYRHQCARMI